MGRPRAFFSPMAIAMVVGDVYPDGGYDWHSTFGPWRLDYQNRVMPAAGDAGAEIRFTASLSGPLGSILERIVRPLSARGQRNRMTRLAEMAEAAESGKPPAAGSDVTRQPAAAQAEMANTLGRPQSHWAVIDQTPLARTTRWARPSTVMIWSRA